MKILQVTPWFVPAKSNGLKTVSHNVAKTLAKRGHEVTVYTTDVDPGCPRLTVREIGNVDGIKVRYFKNMSNWLAAKYRIYLPLKMVWAIREEVSGFDMIHLHDYRNALNAIVHHYAQKYGIPYVLDAHGATPVMGGRVKRGLKRLFDAAFGKRLLRDASMVIAETEVGVNEYKKTGVNQDNIVLLAPPPCDVEEFSQLPPPGNFRRRSGIGEKHMLLFLGRINWIKGLDFLVESFYDLAQSRNDVVLVIAGPDDGRKSTLESLIKKLDIADKVLFPGFLTGEEKLSVLVDASVLIQTSIHEQGAGVPFEAILCDTPIIVSKQTGAGEDVSKIDAGYLVEYGNKSELVDTVQKILDDPTEAMTKTQRAKDYIKSAFSLDRKIGEYEKLYTRCMESVS